MMWRQKSVASLSCSWLVEFCVRTATFAHNFGNASQKFQIWCLGQWTMNCRQCACNISVVPPFICFPICVCSECSNCSQYLWHWEWSFLFLMIFQAFSDGGWSWHHDIIPATPLRSTGILVPGTVFKSTVVYCTGTSTCTGVPLSILFLRKIAGIHLLRILEYSWKGNPVDSQYKKLVGRSTGDLRGRFRIVEQILVYLCTYSNKYIGVQIWIETGRAGDKNVMRKKIERIFEIPHVKGFHVELKFLHSP